MGVFCAFWSADLQSILDVRICSSALSAREYQCLRVWSLGWGLDGHFWEREIWETAVLAGFLHHLDYPFLFFFFFLLLVLTSSTSHTFPSKHCMYYVSHRCSRRTC